MSTDHPTSLAPALQPLAAYRQFILCQLVPDTTRPGKTFKYPLHPGTLQRHDAHDPAAWLSHAEAAALVDAVGHLDGHPLAVGFTITAADPFWFVDIDECLTPTGWSPVAMQVAAMLPGAALEVSQSGRGLHIVGTGVPPAHSCRNQAAGLEFYHELRFMVLGDPATAVGSAAAAPDTGPLVAAYFTPTAAEDGAIEGWTSEPAPEWHGPTDDDELITRALRSTSAAGAFGARASFADLWEARPGPLGAAWPDPVRPYDASGADGALAGHLAFWTGRDCERILRLMKRSALAREKWDRPDGRFGTYLHRTILGAAGRCRTVFGERAATELIATQPAAIGADGQDMSALVFSAAAAGAIPATVATVEATLLSPEAGVRIGRDTFKDRLSIAWGASGAWQPFADHDYGTLRAMLERRGFKPVGPEVMRTAVGMVAHRNQFDSAQQWARGLVWDGVPRMELALTTYYGVPDSPYTRAVSRYLFTGLAGRALVPGCQADMVVILVGLQGARKTSAVSALAPEPSAFGEVDLTHRDDNLARKLRGKLVVEWAEMRGLSGRDLESLKAWASRRVEEWTPKYMEFTTEYPRRCLVIGTANGPELLDDPTGERRWLPVEAGAADVEGLQRDRDQLWAEAVATFTAQGIQWQQAEALARGEHHKYKVHDEWREAIVTWLEQPQMASPEAVFAPGATNGDKPFALLDMMRSALGVSRGDATMNDQKRVGKILTSLNFEKREVRLGKITAKRWVRATGNATGNNLPI